MLTHAHVLYQVAPFVIQAIAYTDEGLVDLLNEAACENGRFAITTCFSTVAAEEIKAAHGNFQDGIISSDELDLFVGPLIGINPNA